MTLAATPFVGYSLAPAPPMLDNEAMPYRHPNTVTASEIADYVFCPESFRLAALGHQSANQPVRDAGTLITLT
jgi:hypothetical protein